MLKPIEWILGVLRWFERRTPQPDDQTTRDATYVGVRALFSDSEARHELSAPADTHATASEACADADWLRVSAGEISAPIEVEVDDAPTSDITAGEVLEK